MITSVKYFLCLWIPLFAFSAVAGKGAHDLGGGNAYEPEFRLIAHQVVSEMSRLGLQDEEARFQIKSLVEAIATVQVYGVENPGSMEAGKIDRHAINSLVGRVIVFNTTIWKTLSDFQKRPYVLHEYLRFTKGLDGAPLEDAVLYEYSVGVIALLSSKNAFVSEAPRIATPLKFCSFVYVGSYAFGQLKTADIFVNTGPDEEILRKDLRQQCFQKKGIQETSCTGAPSYPIKCSDTDPQESSKPWVCQIPAMIYGAADVGRGSSSEEAKALALKACLHRTNSSVLCLSKAELQTTRCHRLEF